MKAIGLILCLFSLWGHGFCCCMFSQHQAEQVSSASHSCCAQGETTFAKDPAGHVLSSPCDCGGDASQSLVLSLSTTVSSPDLPIKIITPLPQVRTEPHAIFLAIPVVINESPPLWVQPDLEHLQILLI
ncbi:MAG: hypothetical protein KDC71_19520 [Acidobacteria bacterium]|nr:hypothetical protein [Acidobacteriota bacterium]